MSAQQANRHEAALFGFPKIGRAGLGNELFPWARAFLWCRDNQAALLAPQWRQLHLGPYLRLERDKRQYHRLFHSEGYIAGWHRLEILRKSPHIGEEGWPSEPDPQHDRLVVRFEGMADYFTPLLGRHAELREELLRITRPEYHPKNLPRGPFIGVHVRLGDFRPPAGEKDLEKGEWNTRIDLAWYTHAIQALREVIGEPGAPAVICSDGGEEELRQVLALPAVSLFRSGSAIGDLFALSQGRMLVASGSSFSGWASFLGQVPTVWYRGQRRQGVIAAKPDLSAEPELAMEAPLPESFGEVAKAAWAGGLENGPAG